MPRAAADSRSAPARAGLRAATGFAAVILAPALLLLSPPGAGAAARYSVVQCGWRAGSSGEWAEFGGGSKFRAAAFCAIPAPRDPFEGAHAASFTRESAGSAAGTSFARWRWTAPAGTGIVGVHGQWWHALRDGFEHRIGFAGSGGGFDPFNRAERTRTWPDHFSAGSAAPRRAFESRLLCARPRSGRCALSPGSFASVRALTLTLLDGDTPRARLGGALLQAGWHSGPNRLRFTDSDRGSGLREGVTKVDGRRLAVHSFPCESASVAGEIRGTRMQPCPERRSETLTVATARLTDGPHVATHCATDFAGNTTCTEAERFRVDNHAPASPLGLSGGGEAWRSAESFSLVWGNPSQGRAAAIAGATYRVLGSGYDSGPVHVPGRGRTSVVGIGVPRPGAYFARVWLRDAAGNEAPASAATAVVRLDAATPSLHFEDRRHPNRPQLVRAVVRDRHSGAAAGRIFYRRAGSQGWTRLPTTFEGRVGQTTPVLLTARFPGEQLPPGRYELMARATDVAGNGAETTRRRDGSRMALSPPLRRPTLLRAWLAGGGARGRGIRVAFGERARVAGRLTTGGGRPLAGELIRITVRPAPGARSRRISKTLRSGPDGRFGYRLRPGTSRRIEVRYAADALNASSGAGTLRLAVRSAVSLQVTPRRLRTGEAIALRGRIATRGARLPRRGKRVDLQYFDSDARRWRPVMAVRTNRRGRFAARYRFRYITGTARIRLRATVPAEGAWPYGRGSSQPVLISVSG